MLAGSVAYGGMVLIMVATPISMHVMDLFSLEETAKVLQAHAIAMFAPSLFTGYLIQKFGVLKIMISGVFLMIICSLVSLIDQHFINYWAGLVLLGVGWNFLFVGGTVYLTTCYRASEAFKSQAFNDFTVFGIQATASLIAGALIFSTSWSFIHYSALVIFFLMLLRLILEMSRPHMTLKVI